MSTRIPVSAAALAFAVLAANAADAATLEANRVVTSIKPLHSLVAGVMKGIGEPALLIADSGSPHTYSLRPSQARDLANAQIVFRIGPELEMFLDKPLKTLAADAKVVDLIRAPGLKTLVFRSEDDDDDEHEHHEHEHEDEHEHEHESEHGHVHAHDGTDPHVWLDPANAVAMVETIARTLADVDPKDADTFWANAGDVTKKLQGLDKEIADTLAPVRDRGYAVFHDSFHYFDDRYGPRFTGAIAISPETAPGAERVKEVRRHLAQEKTTCVFAEPQFEPALVRVVTENTAIRTSTIDPIGAAIKPGPDFYFQLLRSNADAFVKCLTGVS